MPLNPRHVLAAALLLGGCASTAGSCATTDWYQQGYMDGLRTWYSRVDEHAARCAPFGVKPDVPRYDAGWRDGRWDQDHRFK